MKPCPLCAELNPEGAERCTYCNAALGESPAFELPSAAPVLSTKAIASLVCGIAMFFSPVTSVIAIVLGHVSRREIGRSQGYLKGAGMALAGLILGYIGVSIVPLIIAGIAIPNLLQTRMVANEAAAVGNLGTLNKVCLIYSVTYSIGYPAALSNLQPPSGGTASSAAADLIDPVLAAGSKSGYAYSYTPGPAVNGVISTYTINADPIQPGKTGTRYFYTDQSGVIRQNFGGRATSMSPPI